MPVARPLSNTSVVNVSKRLLARLIVVLAAASGGGVWAQAAQDTAAADAILTAPVAIDGEVLFHVRGVSSLPAADRARRIRGHITALAADRAVTVDSLTITDADDISRIQSGDRVIAAVVDADAALEQVSRPVLARAHLARIQYGITLYRNNRTAAAVWRSLTRVLIATGLLLAGIVVLWWLRRRVDSFLVSRLDARIRSVETQSFKVMPAERIWDAVRNALQAVRTLLVLAISLLYAGYVLAQFPMTRGLSAGMATFALGPLDVMVQGVLGSVPGLMFLVVLFILIRLLLRLVRLFFGGLERGTFSVGTFDPDWAQPTYKIVRIMMIAFGLVVAYPYIPGAQSAAFQGISIFAGIMFSLGSSTAIANIVAGYMLIYRRAFKPGDMIKVGEHVGEVTTMRLQVTHLRSPKNEEIIIPNSQLLNSEVVNYSSIGRGQGLILHTEVSIGYSTPWRQVEAMLIEAARRTQGLGAEPRAFVFEKQLGEFAVTYELNVYCTNVHSMRALYAALHRNVLDVFNEHGVQIMTPAYEGDPEQPKIVDPKNWFTTPAKAET
jgi:small-conductance mechanosensitive channel